MVLVDGIFQMVQRGRSISCDEVSGFTIETAGERILAASLSSELKRLLIRPKNVDEFEDTRRLLIETINLTRAARSYGIIEEAPVYQT